MAFRMTIRTDSAAFDEGAAWETARILRAVADCVEQGTLESDYILDYNGNNVGKYKLG